MKQKVITVTRKKLLTRNMVQIPRENKMLCDTCSNMAREDNDTKALEIYRSLQMIAQSIAHDARVTLVICSSASEAEPVSVYVSSQYCRPQRVAGRTIDSVLYMVMSDLVAEDRNQTKL